MTDTGIETAAAAAAVGVYANSTEETIRMQNINARWIRKDIARTTMNAVMFELKTCVRRVHIPR